MMNKIARTTGGVNFFLSRKYVNSKCCLRLTTLFIRNLASYKSTILQPSYLPLNYARAQSKFASYQCDEDFAPVQASDKLASISLADFLSDNASTSDPLASQIDTFNAALTVGKFELRFLFPSVFMNKLDQGFVERMRDQFGAELELLDYKLPECVLKLTCAQEDIQDCMDENAKIICLLVHISHAGGIIGKKRKTLNSIIQQFSLFNGEINVFREACSNSTDSIVQLQTTFIKLPKLIEFLAQIMHSEPIEGLQQQYGAQSYDVSLSEKFSKLLVEKREDFQQRITKNSLIVHLKINVPTDVLSKINGKRNANITRIRRLSSALITFNNAKPEAKFVEILSGVDISAMYVITSERPEFVTAQLSSKPKREKKVVKKYWFE